MTTVAINALNIGDLTTIAGIFYRKDRIFFSLQWIEIRFAILRGSLIRQKEGRAI